MQTERNGPVKRKWLSVHRGEGRAVRIKNTGTRNSLNEHTLKLVEKGKQSSR